MTWLPIITFGLLALVLGVAAVSDWRTHKIPNILTYPAIGAGVLLWVVGGWIVGGPAESRVGLENSLLGLAAALIPFALIFFLGGLGGGDVKLMAAVGAISGSWQCVLSTAVYGFALGAAMALFVMFSKGLARRTMQRIFTAAMFAFSRSKPPLPDDSPRIPYAVALSIGGLLAGAEVLLQLHTPWAWVISGG